MEHRPQRRKVAIGLRSAMIVAADAVDAPVVVAEEAVVVVDAVVLAAVVVVVADAAVVVAADGTKP